MRLLYLPTWKSQQRQFEKVVHVYPVLLAMEAQYYRERGHHVVWEDDPDRQNHIGQDIMRGLKFDKIITKPEGLPFLQLPIPDRSFTNAFDKRYQVYGNYLHHPATHFQAADGCWWGKCKFCVECGKKYQVRSVASVLQEIDRCNMLGFREMFDDSGTFPTGAWLTEFCKRKIDELDCRRDVTLGCNMRLDGDVDYRLMKQAGFRMVLFGIESANQSTLDSINKGTYARDIIPILKRASQAGIDAHGAFMFGYPWESEEEDIKTLELVYYLLRKGYLRTAQASVYDTPESPRRTGIRTPSIYGVAISPEFWWNQIRRLRTYDDFKYLLKCIRKGIVRD